MYIEPEIDCYPAKGKLGKTLYEEVIRLKPEKVINFGVAKGYSLIAIAQGLRDLGRGKVYGYDIEFPYESYINDWLKHFKCEQFVAALTVTDYDKWILNPEEFDLMYVDVNNNTETYLKTYNNLKDQILNKKITILLEGGSKERDNYLKGRRPPIEDAKATTKYKVINTNFPSLSKIDYECLNETS